MQTAHVPQYSFTDAVGVRFRPGGLRALLGASIEVVDGQALDLASVLPAHSAKRATRAASSGSGVNRFSLVSRALDDICSNPAGYPPTRLIRALSHRRIASVQEMAMHAGVSTRQLERLVRNIVGISPKALIRIHRFRRAVRLRVLRQLSWSDAVLHAGYYDQSHFTNECRAITGFSPARLARLIETGRACRV
jgi:AraC-like DNA-binding protein